MAAGHAAVLKEPGGRFAFHFHARDLNYQLIRQPGAIADRLFDVEFLDAGVEAYCFTFG